MSKNELTSQDMWRASALITTARAELPLIEKYITSRNTAVWHGGSRLDGEWHERVAQDIVDIRSIVQQGQQPVFVGKEYWSSDVAKLPNDKNLKALLRPALGLMKDNFAILPNKLEAVKNEIDISKLDIDAESLDLWLRFAILVAKLPTVAGQQVGVAGVVANSVHQLVTWSFRRAVSDGAIEKSMKSTHMGPSGHDSNTGHISMNTGKYQTLLKKVISTFHKDHGKTIAKYGVGSLVVELEDEARKFEGKTTYY